MLSVSHSQQCLLGMKMIEVGPNANAIGIGIGKTQPVRTRRLQSRMAMEQGGGGRRRRRRVFLLDVNPLCYSGTRPSLQCLADWLSLFFRQVSLTDPVIAVLDGEGGAQRRRQLLPCYKAHRHHHHHHGGTGSKWAAVGELLGRCGVPVVRVPGEEADDVIATLASQAVHDKGLGVVIASPDKDFMQLLSEDVQMVMPLSELRRWSFYTLRHYASQHRNSHPRSDLSLRCLLGDPSDGIPGIQHLAPGFGRRTAVKLLTKHSGSLEELLRAASVRTVAKQYAQNALVKHADFLRRNFMLLSLRTDVHVTLEDHWLTPSNQTTNLDAAITKQFCNAQFL